MIAPKRILILGDGAAGTIMANKMRFHTDMKDVEIVVVGNSPKHYFKPDGVHIPFSLKRYQDSVKPTRFLFNYGIDYVQDEVVKIDVEQRFVYLKSGRRLNYDYLIIATGDRFTPEEIPGYEGEAKHFYDLQHSLELRESLKDFKGGNIVIGQASIPIQCPPAPYEFTFLLEQYLRSKGIRDKTNIHYIYPLNRVFTIENVSRYVESLFDEKGIEYHTMFNVESINAKNKELVSLEGESLNYDLLILVPPHKGQKVITESGLAGESGYIDVDRHKLNYADYDDVFVIGDATNLPISKAGATAHFEAEYLANKFAHEISGNVYDEQYDGEVSCTTITGAGKAITLYFSYERPPRASFQSKTDYLLKWTSSDTYFSGMLRGIM